MIKNFFIIINWVYYTRTWLLNHYCNKTANDNNTKDVTLIIVNLEVESELMINGSNGI